jgi:hypothetical protein
MKLRILMASAVVAAATACAAAAEASTYSVLADSQGWIRQDGADNTPSAANNYVAGNCGLGDCGAGEFRNLFTFTLPSLDGVLSSATLFLDTAEIHLQQDSTITYQVTSTSGFNFASLGTGVLFGSRTYSEADAMQVLGITLNADALSAIAAGGTLTLSGRVTSPTTFDGGALNQYLFGRSGDGPANRLDLVTGASAVPEPETWALMIVGLGGAGMALRANRRRLAAA